MKGLIYIAITLATLVVSVDASAQSRAYAKFDSNGATIGLFNLTEDNESCRDRPVLIGTATNVFSSKRGKEVRYTFLFDTGYKRRVIGFALDVDAIPTSVVRDLLTDKRRLSIGMCRLDGRWFALEITRAGVAVLPRPVETDLSPSSEPDHK